VGTPAERAVIAAARRLVEGNPYNIIQNDRTAMNLAEAVDALDATEHPADGGPREIPITWGQLVAGDELWSARAGKWFEVLETKAVGGETEARLTGVGKPFRQPSDTPAKVRRSPMGEAVDLFATVIWSGPNGT